MSEAEASSSELDKQPPKGRQAQVNDPKGSNDKDNQIQRQLGARLGFQELG